MPQTGMDWWVIVGVLAGIAGAFFAWRQIRKPKRKTTNTITSGSGNTQTGGPGETSNAIDRGDNNNQSG
jgi:LPXTG-motif cell wall-anchored protein